MTNSYLSLVRKVDGARTLKGVYRFLSHDNAFLGNILPMVASQLKSDEAFRVDKDDLTVTILAKCETERTRLFHSLCSEWRAKKQFSALSGWRNELYSVYNPHKTLYFKIERSAACLFGLVMYGAHITGYVPAKDPSQYKVWVPRRSYTKTMDPGLLDNTVAGGLGHPFGPWETAIKECQEEAGLTKDYLKQNLRPAGVISYELQYEQTLESEAGLYQPEVGYVFDLIMEDGVQPHPEDGEVHEFNLMSLREVQERLLQGEFTDVSALIMIDFLARHGIITPETEPDYLQILKHCHREFKQPLR